MLGSLSELWCCSGRPHQGPHSLANANAQPVALEGAANQGSGEVDQRPAEYLSPHGRRSWIVAGCAEDVVEIKVDETAGVKRRTIVGTVSTVVDMTSSAPAAQPATSDFGILAPPQDASRAKVIEEVMESNQQGQSQVRRKSIITGASAAITELGAAGSQPSAGDGGDFGVSGPKYAGGGVRFASQAEVAPAFAAPGIEEKVEVLVGGVRRTTRKSTHSSWSGCSSSGPMPAASPAPANDFGISAPPPSHKQVEQELQQLSQQVDNLALRDQYQRLAALQLNPEVAAAASKNRRNAGRRATAFGGNFPFGKQAASKEGSGAQKRWTVTAGGMQDLPAVDFAQLQALIAGDYEEAYVVGDGSEEDLKEQEKMKMAMMSRRRDHTVFHRQAEAAVAWAEVNIKPETREWAGADASDDDNQEDREKQAYKAREKRLTAGALQLEKELILADEEVSVVPQSKEWAGAADSDEEESPKRLNQRASVAYQAREMRLSIGAGQLQKDLKLADAEVDIFDEDTEWAGAGGAVDSDDEAGPNRSEQQASQAYEAREKRLTVGAEQMQKELMMADSEVGVVAESKEWAGGDDSDDDRPNQLEQQASQAFQAREKRLTIGAEQLEVQKKELNLEDVSVVAQVKEWAADVDSDDEESSSPKRLEQRASQAYNTREKRLTWGAGQLQKELRLADAEVGVVAEKKEWAGAADSDDEGANNLDKVASQAYDAREKRLTIGQQELEKGMMLADAEVGVVAQNKEWAAEEDSDDEGPNLLEQRASRAYQQREQRLTFGAEQMQKEAMLADAEMNVVAETKEWEGDVDSEEDDVPNWQEKRETQVFNAREKRLTINALQLEQEMVLADAEVSVVAEAKEWGGVADSDDEDGPNHLEQRASQAYSAREKRLTVGAEQLQKDLMLADAEVGVVAESKEWAGAADSDEEPGAKSGEQQLEQNASQAYEAREKRLTIGAEQLQKEMMLADAEVSVTAESKEWAGAADSDDEETQSPKQLEQRASQAYSAREKRLTVGAEQMQKELMLADSEVGVVAESKEWAGEADSDDDDNPNTLAQRASQAYQAREKRLTVGAEVLQEPLVG